MPTSRALGNVRGNGNRRVGEKVEDAGGEVNELERVCFGVHGKGNRKASEAGHEDFGG
jgi:hypothetical protein